MKKIIKIQIPITKEIFNINLSGEENQIKDLISLLAKVSPEEIKGLKDRYGNYYTFSSAVQDKNINSSLSDLFTLICSSTQINLDRRTKINQSNYSSENEDYNKEESHLQEFIAFTKELLERNLIDEKFYNSLLKSIVEENIQIILLYKNFFRKFIDFKCFLSNLYRIANEINTINHEVAPFKRAQTNNNVNYYEILTKNLGRYFQNSEINILKKAIDLNEEFVISAFDLFISNQDLEDFADSIKRYLNRTKKDSIILENNHLANSERVNTETKIKIEGLSQINTKAYSFKEKEEKINEGSPLNVNNIESSKELQEANMKSNEEIQRKFDNQPLPIKTNSSNVAVKTLSEAQIQMINRHIHTDQRAILSYMLSINSKEIAKIIETSESTNNESTLIQTVKTLCIKFINENIISQFTEKEAEIFGQVFRRNQRDKVIYSKFKKFLEDKNLNKLIEEVKSYLNTLIIAKENEETNDISKKENEFSYNPKNSKQDLFSYLNKEVKLNELLNEEERKELEQLIQKEDNETLNIVNLFIKNRNMNELRNNLNNLFKKSPSDDSPNRSMMSFSPKKNKVEGKIISKLESSINHNLNTSMSREYQAKDSKNSRVSKADQIPLEVQFETCLKKLVDEKEISNHQMKFTVQRFISKDTQICQIFEEFRVKKNKSEFVENVKNFADAVRKVSVVDAKTPAPLKRGRDQIDKFRIREREEKEEIKNKQRNIINMITQLLSEDLNKFIHEMIESGNNILLYNFEVFAITKDFRDFIETLSLIHAIYKGESVEIEHQQPAQEDGVSFVEFFEQIVNKLSKLTRSENKTIIELIRKKDFLAAMERNNLVDEELISSIVDSDVENEKFIDALKAFSNIKDNDDFCETLTMICSSLKKNKPKSKSVTKNQPDLMSVLKGALTKMGKKVSKSDANEFIELLSNENGIVIGALQFYLSNPDEDELLETLKISLGK